MFPARRAFLRTCTLATGALLLGGVRVLEAAEALRVGLILPEGGAGKEAADAAALGARLGAEEAGRAAELLGRRLELLTATDTDPDSLERAAVGLVEEGGVFALLGGFDEASCRTLGEVAERREVLFFNLGCRSDALRGSACRPSTFHVEASAAMYRDALLATRLHGGAEGALVEAALWHGDLTRFGAGQLNDRARARFGHPLDSPGWTGWMGVKLLWEAALRARTTDATRLIAFLESGRAQFDGHKGLPLSFRHWNHQLRQPLYLVRRGGSSQVVGEVPVRGAELEDAREVLDRLGGEEAASDCRFSPL